MLIHVTADDDSERVGVTPSVDSNSGMNQNRQEKSVCLNLIVAADVTSTAVASLAIPCFLSCSESNACNGTCASPVPPLSPVEVEKAASTIQSHFRKFQQKKQKNGK